MEQGLALLTGTCCPPQLAVGRARRSRKTPERGKRQLASLTCYLLAIVFAHRKKREGAQGGSPCLACAGRPRKGRSAVKPPGLKASHLFCLWLAVGSAPWLLLPGVGRVCLSVPGRGGRPEFEQTSYTTLAAGVLVMALYLGACSGAWLCIWLGKWQCRASRVQNALEVRPPVVRLRSRGTGAMRRGPVAYLQGQATVCGPAGVPTSGLGWLRELCFWTPRGRREQRLGTLKGNPPPCPC